MGFVVTPGIRGKSERLEPAPYLSRQQVDDLKSVLDNADSHQLLAVVAAVHHHGVGQTLHNGALGLAETLGGITSSRVWQVLGVLLFHGNVILGGKQSMVSVAA